MTTNLQTSPQKSAYQDAGVDVTLADQMIRSWQPKFAATARAERIESPLGFGGLMEVPDGYDNPVLVSGTDGVGTKLKIAFETGRHNTVGIDLVAMCVNDIIVYGAEPLFFLDYLATGQLDSEICADIMEGIAAGCQQAKADLIGGETAEMPGMYAKGEYDLAGFCVGVVEKKNIIDGRQVAEGDVVIGLASTGFHSNGFSLIRKLLADNALSLTADISGRTLADVLMTPTAIYVRPVLDILAVELPHAIAHITGGGLPGNLSRVIPAGLGARIKADAWKRAPEFDWLQQVGNLSEEEMLQTFNCGIGMALIAAPQAASSIRQIAESHNIQAEKIGAIVRAADRPVMIE